MGMSFKDYINESTRNMFSDNYITEAKFVMNGKAYPSKKAAEAELKKRGFSGSKLNDALSRGKFGGKIVSQPVKNKPTLNKKDEYEGDEFDSDLMNNSDEAYDDRDVRHRNDKTDDDGNYLKDRIQEKIGYDWHSHLDDIEQAQDYYVDDKKIPAKLKARLKEHIKKSKAANAEYKKQTDKWDSEKKATKSSDNKEAPNQDKLWADITKTVNQIKKIEDDEKRKVGIDPNENTFGPHKDAKKSEKLYKAYDRNKELQQLRIKLKALRDATTPIHKVLKQLKK